MRCINNKLVLPIVAVTIAGAVLFGTSSVFAQDTDIGTKTIVQRLAEKFNLEEADVQTVFDDAHKEHQTQMKARFEEKLSQLVTDGKITETQKQAIIKRFAEMKGKRMANHEAIQNMTPEERKKAKEDLKSEMEAWEKEYGIDLKTLFGGMGSPGMKKMHFMMR